MEACTTRTSSRRGWHVIATRHLCAAEGAFSERAVVCALNDEHLRRCCSLCLTDLYEPRSPSFPDTVCPECKIVSYCNTICQAADLDLHALSGECALLSHDISTCRDVRLSLRLLQAWLDQPSQWSKMLCNREALLGPDSRPGPQYPGCSPQGARPAQAPSACGPPTSPLGEALQHTPRPGELQEWVRLIGLARRQSCRSCVLAGSRGGPPTTAEPRRPPPTLKRAAPHMQLLFAVSCLATTALSAKACVLSLNRAFAAASTRH
ncbi:hypothetical protein CYMTET_35532 [Cymbomonas tetramitiformis]|uniref:MYND-type domain-containing protein n=1 Tax=Cymbomonas tetramitiformis TaxID=36881 RepID=A0AAE0KP13_9CHLO|nr:hypothetical protein CYMTET_35532 [Cymbomonas tetramitiformis]